MEWIGTCEVDHHDDQRGRNLVETRGTRRDLGAGKGQADPGNDVEERGISGRKYQRSPVQQDAYKSK